ncbi:MAG TPA: OB-fold nucleic acid binding domain-containing protein, partial [Cytophagaceae bacterium]
PGPMQFIPNFVNRKHGREKVEYPHDLLEPILNYTYGIMVYQEQIMQTAQIIAGYSLGGADLLRRAMGKKDKEKMAKERVKFVKGAKEINEIPEGKANDIFDIMEKFAEYGFNRSHSAAYSVVAYQTAYLKANYPAEYMASVLTHNMSNIEKVSFFMDECKRQNIPVLGPDVNESGMYFDVNKEGKIRFGLGAIKGTGEAAVESILMERDLNGPYTDIFSFAERVNLRTVNKKTFESLAYAGAFDIFQNIHRRQYFNVPDGDSGNLIEKAIKYGNAYRNEKDAAQVSMFGGESNVAIPLPKIAECECWSDIEKLKYEKDVVGFYISGHPLDQFKLELDHFCTCSVDKIFDFKGRDISIAGIVTKSLVRQGKNGKSFVIFSLEDFVDTVEMALFGEDYLTFEKYIKAGQFLYIKGKIQQRYNTDQWEFKPQVIHLLQDIRNKLCKNIQISIDVHELTHEVIDSLEHLLQENTGPCDIKVVLLDGKENYNVEMQSRKFKIEPNNILLEELKQLQGVNLKIVA